jgi:hypothetical protein
MKLEEAIDRATAYSQENGEATYIILEDDDWDWATEEDMDGFYLGAVPRYTITPEGEVLRGHGE